MTVSVKIIEIQRCACLMVLFHFMHQSSQRQASKSARAVRLRNALGWNIGKADHPGADLLACLEAQDGRLPRKERRAASQNDGMHVHPKLIDKPERRQACCQLRTSHFDYAFKLRLER